MIEPKTYDVNTQASPQDYREAGFDFYSGVYGIKKVLYKYPDKTPYVTLTLLIEGEWLVVNVNTDSGETYPPFYNPDLRHGNFVYEEVAETYNHFMDKLVRKKILKHRKGKKNGRNKN